MSRPNYAFGSISTSGIVIAFFAMLKGADPMNDIATLGNDAGFSVFFSGIMSSDSRHPTRWSDIFL